MSKSILITILILSVSYFSVFEISKFNENSKNLSNKYFFDADVNPKERELYFERLVKDPETGEIPIESIIGSKNYISTLIKNKSYKNHGKLLSNYDWNVRGPFQIGGRVRALAIDSRDENRILAAGASGGLWLSTNNGSTWKKVTNSYDNHSVTCIVQDTRPGKENNWYYGTGERIASKFRYGFGIYKSTDNGETWNKCIGTTNNNQRGSWDNPFDFIFSLAIDPSASIEDDVLLASTALGGIQRTTDGGETWEKVLGSNFGNSSSAYSEILVDSKGNFYATLSKYTNSGQYNAPLHGIFRSDDGINWVKINGDEYSQNYSRIVAAINPQNENELYFFALTQNEGKQTFNHQMDELYHSLYKYSYLSGDGSGENGIWNDLSQNLPKPEIVRQQTNTQGGYNMVIAVHPTNENVVYIGDVNVWRSTDAFTSEDNLTLIGGTCRDESCDYDYRYPNHHSDIHAFIFSKENPNVLYTGTDGGVHKTNNSLEEYVEWISLNNGFYTTQFYDIGIARRDIGNTNILGGMQDNGTLYTNNLNESHFWTDVLRGDGFNNEMANDGSFIITSKNSTPQPKINIWKSELNEEGKVVNTRRIDPIGGRDFSWNTPFALDPNNNDLLYVAGGAILWRQNELTKIELTNEKDSIIQGWDSLTHTFVKDYNWDSPRSGEIISAVSVSREPANIVYYGTTRGKIYKIENANEGDPTPIEITGSEMPRGSNINCIAINPINADEIICVYSNYNTKSIFHSNNGGNSWTHISGTLEEYSDGSGGGPAVQWVDIMPMGDNTLYFAGTSDGLFVTSILLEKNTPWEVEALETIGTAWISSINSRYEDGFVAVGTYSQGVYNAYINTLPNKLQAPQIINNEYIDVLDTLTIDWNQVDNALLYKIELSDSPNFENVIYEDFSKTNNIKLTNLEQGFKKYFVRVSTVNSGGLSDFSENINITTFLDSPNPIYPANNETDIPYELEISWSEVENAENYRFQLNTLNVFTNPRIDTLLSTNKIILKLDPNKNYRWRVASIKEEKYGNYSEVFLFKTSSVSRVYNSNDKIKISPNPSSNYINIETKDNLNLEGFKITIFKSNGELMLKSSFKKQIDISKFENGKYFLIFERENIKFINNFTKVK